MFHRIGMWINVSSNNCFFDKFRENILLRSERGQCSGISTSKEDNQDGLSNSRKDADSLTGSRNYPPLAPYGLDIGEGLLRFTHRPSVGIVLMSSRRG